MKMFKQTILINHEIKIFSCFIILIIYKGDQFWDKRDTKFGEEDIQAHILKRGYRR